MVQHTSCRAPNTAGLVDVHLVVLGGPLRIAVFVVVLRVFLSVAPSLDLAAAGRKEVVDGAGEQIAAFRRDVFEDGFRRRLALVDMCDLVGAGC